MTTDAAGSPFTGRGWGFPLRTTPSGGIALVDGDTEIAEAVRLVLGTARGERPMRPEFGCGIHDLVFAPADPALLGRIEEEVRASLRRWEPRITVEQVDAAPAEDDTGTVWITVRYLVLDTDDPRNLVFPFYALPSEE
ncbi:MAG: baseplate protein [Frankiales bacterium]|nr:baseplate protein [Frankiales bacterium]